MADLIDRQKAIRNICNEDCHRPTPCKWKYIAIEELEALPSAQPRKGKWIDYSDEGYVKCPFCHSATNCDGNKDELHYCFSCGAELR